MRPKPRNISVRKSASDVLRTTVYSNRGGTVASIVRVIAMEALSSEHGRWLDCGRRMMTKGYIA